MKTVNLAVFLADRAGIGGGKRELKDILRKGCMRMKLFDPNLKFYKGNLHTHTTISDGVHTPEEAMAEYQAHGYDFMAITDHWKVGGERKYENMLVLPGVEYDFTFPTQVLHVVSIYPDAAMAAGVERGMDHRDVIRHVNQCGGVNIAAHPAWSLNTHDFLCGLEGVEISEIYNSLSNEPFNSPRGDGSGILDVTAANGKLYRLVATDDTHFYQGEQCMSYTMVQAEELTVDGILNGLKSGRFYASQGPEFLNVEMEDGKMIVETSPVCMCTFVSNRYWVGGRCRTGENMTRQVYELQPGEKFIRCVITDSQGRKAWTSPLAL